MGFFKTLLSGNARSAFGDLKSDFKHTGTLTRPNRIPAENSVSNIIYPYHNRKEWMKKTNDVKLSKVTNEEQYDSGQSLGQALFEEIEMIKPVEVTVTETLVEVETKVTEKEIEIPLVLTL
jgi:hypothetical protein